MQADEPAETRREIQLLQEQNQNLQDQLRRQQSLIETLSRQMDELRLTAPARSQDLGQEPPAASTASSRTGGFNLGQVRISGEGGVGFFRSDSQGMFPNSEFRIDEARLFVEAPVWGDVYFYSELDLATREEPDVQLRLGETYLEFENVSRLWNREGWLNVRAGRMYIPFGEEYQWRYAIDNPLISHSLSDLWGVDEGVEFYGRMGKVRYVVAVQNGGISDTRDFNSDKSIAGRVDFDAARWLHLSASGMRTGALDAQQDQFSALWLANGFLRSLGSAAATTFHGELVEGDVAVRLPHGHVNAFGGYIHYGDNDPGANNQRDMYYYAVEGVRDLTKDLYAGVRWSQIFARGGFPLVGNGDFGEYFFGNNTEELWRLSLGLGYRFSANLVVKLEYSLEQGRGSDGEERNHENQVAAEAAFKF